MNVDHDGRVRVQRARAGGLEHCMGTLPPAFNAHAIGSAASALVPDRGPGGLSGVVVVALVLQASSC